MCNQPVSPGLAKSALTAEPHPSWQKFYDGDFPGVKFFDASQKIESQVTGMGTEGNQGILINYIRGGLKI
jgi:hypothetical protein